MTWIQQLDEARASRAGGVIVTFNTNDRVFSEEEGRAKAMNLPYFLAARFSSAGFCVGQFTLAGGFTLLNPPNARVGAGPFSGLEGSENTLLTLRRLDTILRTKAAAPCLLLLDYGDHIASAQIGVSTPEHSAAAIEMLHRWGLDDDIRRAGNFVIIISRENSINRLVQHESGFPTITIGLPAEETRRAFSGFLVRARKESAPSRPLGELEAGLPLEEFARITNGLRLNDIEDLFCRAAVTGTPVSRDAVRMRKRLAISDLCHGVLEVIEPDAGFESVAGCRAAKEYFEAIKPLWARGSNALPQGVLLAGTPGSGKSFLVKALAKEFNVPLLVMRGVREQWVGASERNMERVLQVAESMAPCLIWTDEVDQQLGGERSSGPSGDSGVSERLFGRLLEFFGDSRIRGRILWVATTNRPDLLDMAIKDRFSVKLPFLHPSASERAALLPILAKQVGRALESGLPCDELARREELAMLSVRALQDIVVWAGTQADIRLHGDAASISQQDLERAIADYKATFDPVEQELIALIALQMTSFNSLLPWVGLTGFRRDANEWPIYLAEIVDGKTGHLDQARLQQRISTLRDQRHVQRAFA